MLKEILVAAILVLGIPSGFLIAWLCREELVQGRAWFKIIIFLSIIIAILSFVMMNIPVSLTMIFMIIVSLISLGKSFDKKWTNRRI